MAEFVEKYVNPLTDFGFKKLFGEDANKDLLLDFISELLRGEQDGIKDISYLRSEPPGVTDLDRCCIFDLVCENEQGVKFLIELQKPGKRLFGDKALYYAAFPILEPIKLFGRSTEISAVYTVAVLDFAFDGDQCDPDKYRHNLIFNDKDTGKNFYGKHTFICLEIPKFNKSIDDLKTQSDKWMYLIKNLNKLNSRPEIFSGAVFDRLFQVAETAKLSCDQATEYVESRKTARESTYPVDSAMAEGIAIGKAQGIIEGMKRGAFEKAKDASIVCLKKGMAAKDISKITGLSVTALEEIWGDLGLARSEVTII